MHNSSFACRRWTSSLIAGEHFHFLYTIFAKLSFAAHQAIKTTLFPLDFGCSLCFCQNRTSARLGQSLRIPFRDDYIALHISVVFSIIVATMVRALEIVLCGFYPGLPRFAIARRMVSWVCFFSPMNFQTRHLHAVSSMLSTLCVSCVRPQKSQAGPLVTCQRKPPQELLSSHGICTVLSEQPLSSGCWWRWRQTRGW